MSNALLKRGARTSIRRAVSTAIPADRLYVNPTNTTQLLLNGQPFRASGINWHWVGLRESTHPESNLSATGNYPTHAMIDEGLDAVLALVGPGGVIRAHTLGISAGLPAQLVTGISSSGALTWNTAAFEPLDYFLNGCRTRGLYALGVLTDPYWYYHRGLLWWVQQAFINQGTSGIPSTYTDTNGATLGTNQTSIDPTVSVYATQLQKAKSLQFYRNSWIMSAFIDSYVPGLLNHVNQYNGIAYKDDSAFAFIQAGNELALSGTQYPDHANADGVAWQARLFAKVRSLAPRMLTVDGMGAENTDPSKAPGVADPNTDVLDIQHLYQDALTAAIVTDNAAKAATANKVAMVGELPMRRSTDVVYAAIEQTGAVALDFTWALYTTSESHNGGTADGSSGNDDTTYYPSDTAWRTIQRAHADIMRTGAPVVPAAPRNIINNLLVSSISAPVSTFSSGSDTTAPTLALDTFGGRTGAALRVTNTAAGFPYVYMTTATDGAPVTPGATYTASAWVRQVTGTLPNMVISISWYTSTGSYIATTNGTGFVAGSTYVQGTCTAKAPKNGDAKPGSGTWTQDANFAVVQVQSATQMAASTAFNIDDLAITLGSSTVGAFGDYKPSAATTGYPASTSLTVQTPGSGTLTITTPGTVIDGVDLHGYLDIRANNVIVKNSIIRGSDTGPGTTQTALISCFSNSPTGVVIQDCTLLPTVQTVYVDGLKGSGFTATRLDVSKTVDCVVLYGTRTTVVQGCYLHDNIQYANDPNQSNGPSHNDGIQIQQATNFTVRGNTIKIATPGNSVIQVTQDVGLINGLVIDQNWLDGGNLGLNTSEKAQGAYTGFVVTNNKFGRSFALGTGTTVGVITSTTKATSTITGNVREDDSSAVTFGNAGS